MADKQKKHLEAVAGSSGSASMNVACDSTAGKVNVETTTEPDREYSYPPAWNCWVIDKHRKCCWNFLTKEEQADVFNGLKAQRDVDGTTFAKAIIKPNARKMIALINTVTGMMCKDGGISAVVKHKVELERASREKAPEYPFQHGGEWTLLVVPGVKVPKIPEETSVEARKVADETDLVDELDNDSHSDPTLQQSEPRSSSLSANIKEKSQDSKDEDLDTHKGEAAKPKKKKRNRRKTRKTNTGITASPIIENIDTVSSCGATAEDSIQDPRDVPCHWSSSVAIHTSIDYWNLAVAGNRGAKTYTDGPDDPNDKRTLYNHDADEILEEDLVRLNIEHPFTSAETVPGPEINVEGYGDTDCGVGPEIRRWLKLDGSVV